MEKSVSCDLIGYDMWLRVSGKVTKRSPLCVGSDGWTQLQMSTSVRVREMSLRWFKHVQRRDRA